MHEKTLVHYSSVYGRIVNFFLNLNSILKTQKSDKIPAIFGVSENSYENVQMICIDDQSLDYHPRTATINSTNNEIATPSRDRSIISDIEPKSKSKPSPNGYFNSISVPFTQRFYPKSNESNNTFNSNNNGNKLFDKLMNSTGLNKRRPNSSHPTSRVPRPKSENEPKHKPVQKTKGRSHEQDDFVIV